MKQFKYIITILLVLGTAIACKKEPETYYDWLKNTNSGTVTASLNSKPWQSDHVETRLASNSNQRIIIEVGIFVNGTIRQHLAIGGIYLNNDKQVVYNGMRWSTFDQTGWPRGKDTCVASYFLTNGDAGENSYGILEGEENYIQLEGYDKSSPRVKGSFQLSLYRSRPNIFTPTQGLPDTLRFTNGQFDVEIMKYD